MHVIITCKHEKDWIKSSREKGATPFFPHYNPICCHGNQLSDLANVKLIQALMYVIVTCKYEKDPIMNSREKVETSFSIISLWGFFQTFKGSQLRSQWLDQAEIRTRPRSHACHRNLKV